MEGGENSLKKFSNLPRKSWDLQFISLTPSQAMRFQITHQNPPLSHHPYQKANKRQVCHQGAPSCKPGPSPFGSKHRVASGEIKDRHVCACAGRGLRRLPPPGFCKVTWPTGGGVRELWAVRARAPPSASSGTCWPEGPLVAPNRQPP